MRHRNIKLSALFFLIAGSILLTAKPMEYGRPDYAVHILIAQEQTRFKKKLVEELIKQLDNGKTYIKVVDHKRKELEKENPTDYNAVFITNSGVNSQIRPWVKEWVMKYPESREKIIIHTTQREVWTPEIDSLTSASTISQVERLAMEYADEIKKRL